MQEGGNKSIRGDVDMTTKEISRLIDWLKSHGHTYPDIEECIDYISQENNQTATNKKTTNSE